MKRLTCEMCGSTELIKQEGVFVCQICGCKYSVEEAKKMMVEGTVEVTGTVRIDKSDNYNNLLQLARDAITDGHFDGAYNYSSEALTIHPNEPELVAIQGLAVLGKEELRGGIPTSSVNAVKKMFTLLEESTSSGSEKLGVLKNVNGYIDVVCKERISQCWSEIRDLNSQKVGYSEDEERDVLINLKIYSVESRQRDIQSFQKTYQRQIDTAVRKYTDVAEKERDAYWEAHPEEKEKLETNLQDLNGELENIKRIWTTKKETLSVFMREVRDFEPPIAVKGKEIMNQIHYLRSKRDSLGIFKGREKKELDAKIEVLNSQKPSYDDVRNAKKEYQDSKAPEIKAMQEEVKSIEAQQKELTDKITSVRNELTRFR